MDTAFFPLDKELDLGNTSLLPHAHETLVRLGARMPFEQAGKELYAILGIQVSRSTARRRTLQVGSACLQIQTRQAHPRAACPEEEAGKRMGFSTDGAFVRLVHREWAEVKLVAMGWVEQRRGKNGLEPRTEKLSYFARLTDATTFADQASGEIRRRGLDRAEQVCAVQDGADWVQGFVQSHRADAVRILDFAHAAQRLAEVVKALVPTPHAVTETWLQEQLHALKHEGPDGVLSVVENLYHQSGEPEAIGEHLRYLQKRVDQMQYPIFQSLGWPLGSGMVESGNKTVMQARLKGAGMQWRREHVNPMLALQMALRNDRWRESWQASHQALQEQRQQIHREQFHRKHQQRQEAQVSPPPPPVPPARPKGRTEAQNRWGRQTFSRRRLCQQAELAKQ